MAHTTRVGSTSFIHNGDAMDGDVTIVVRTPDVREVDDDIHHKHIDVSGRDLLAFAAQYFIGRKIADLEDIDVDEFINRFEI